MNIRRKIHRIEGMLDRETRKRLRSFTAKTEIERAIGELNNTKNGKEDLMIALEEVLVEPWRTKIIETLLGRKDIALTDLLEVLLLCHTDESFCKTCERILEVGIDINTLLSLIERKGRMLEWAYGILTSRMEEGVIEKSLAIETLIKLLKDIPDKRKDIWKLIKKLSPSREQVFAVIILDGNINREIIDEAQRLAAKLAKKPKTSRLARKIISLANEQKINQEKGQD